IQCPYCDTSFY
ncbi:na(+)-translocating NADH-quinone reductase subunit F, partial [Chlamydia psittaci 08-2626_L3]